MSITKELMVREGITTLPANAFPGGYTIVYFFKGECYCANCATKLVLEGGKVVSHDLHWQGAPLECNDCNVELESAYGDPEEDKQ